MTNFLKFDLPFGMTIDVAKAKYRTGKPGYVREWDGHAWVGEKIEDPDIEPLPHRGTDGKSRHWWMTLVVGGFIIAAVLTHLGTRDDKPVFWLLGIVGFVSCGATLLALALVAWRRLRLSDVVPLKIVIPLGVLSGSVAIGLAVGLETLQGKIPGPVGSQIGTLLGAGPIEETVKLLVPVLLFLYVGGTLREPRIGFALTFLSGLTFGMYEGIEYAVGSAHGAHDDHLHKMLNGENIELIEVYVHIFSRPFVELMHPLTVASVAAVAWLVAWRGGSFFSRPAIMTYLMVIAYHSINDGVISGMIGDQAPLVGIGLNGLFLFALFRVVYMPRARQLAPPLAVEANPRRWRPE